MSHRDGRGPATRHFLRLCVAAMLFLALSSCVSTASERRRLAAGYAELGNAYAEIKSWEKAGLAWSRALELDPANGPSGFNLIRALTEAKKYAEAIERAESLLAADPDNALVLSAYAYALHKAGRNDGAKAAYERVVALNAEDESSVFNLAALYELSGDDEKARGLYQRLVDAGSPEKRARLRLGFLLEKAGEREAAIHAFEQYLGLDAKSAAAQLALARLYEETGAYAKAITTLLALTALDSSKAAYWWDLARLRLTKAEDADGGLDALEKALAAGFDDKPAAALLFAEATLVEKEAVGKLLADKKLLPDSTAVPGADETGER